ncbi:CPBP family intramembrane metalloprotease [Lentzea sp. NBC_00516]|uniref:CPBP family intramembrane glutamic endopeptidase n=1 Tax=Lentzea sp. NBC_00516 TaxID=2903582 RepID=UPI002E80D54B|nr:CPBP family intramembrane glutamic endopeptidase [Lentzea sp. NBC_00516]WUD26053.1 CPBP family intramembrane metalloprotease [Lentzea sp. NBC_00516]
MERSAFPDDSRSAVELSVRRLRLRTFRFPVLFVSLFVVMLAVVGIDTLVAPLPLLALPIGIGLAAAGIVCYRRLSQTVEVRDDVPELESRGRWRGLGRGALLGFGLFCAMMLVILVFGGVDGLSWGSFFGFLGLAGMMSSVAVMEEVLFRGVLFRILEERAGTVISLVVSSLLFGATHLVNVNATLWGALAIGLTGGAMLASAYVVTQSLWFPIGLHFAWNFTHAGLFGIAVSGSNDVPNGLLRTTLSGSSVLTGGTFGPEASLIALLVCLAATVLLLRRAARAGQIRPWPARRGK